MDFHDILDILLPIFALVVVVLITARSILASGTRASISLTIYFVLIGVYKWYTKMNKNLDLYTYILDSLNEKKLWWWSFCLLIFIIQYFMLFDYSIKNMTRQFNVDSFFMCISLCLICNLLLSISTLSIALPIRNIVSLINPGYSTLVMLIIFITTYLLIFILRQFFSL